MLILIEGSDGLGKTTLAKALQWKLHCAYVHNTAPAAWQLSDFYYVLPNSVYDRFHYSMWAYKKYSKQPLDLTIDDLLAIDERLSITLDGDYASVLLYASDPGYFDNMPEDHFVTCEQIKDVNEQYKLLIPHATVAIDVATTGYPSAEQVLDLLGL